MGSARELPGIEEVYDKATAARCFELPLDREGDVVVVGDTGTCIGAAEADHDLSGLKGHRLRTHGGISERRVPFILNRPLRPEYAARARRGAAAQLPDLRLRDQRRRLRRSFRLTPGRASRGPSPW